MGDGQVSGLNPAQYRAICFDLDGTLLPMDLDGFMQAYFKGIASFVAKRGLDAKRFMEALKAGTKAMAMDHLGIANRDVFWDEFHRVYPEPKGVAEEVADEFYATDFKEIGKDVIANPSAAKAIFELAAKGYPLALTTMPMFPLAAVKARLAWAGIDPDVFARITSYENSSSIKPRETYFAENVSALGASGADILMVGNNTIEDLSFCALGCDPYLVTDWLINDNGFDIDSIKHGSMDDFAKWAASLPECPDPATDIECGLVPKAETEEVLKRLGTDSASSSFNDDYASNITDTIDM